MKTLHVPHTYISHSRFLYALQAIWFVFSGTCSNRELHSFILCMSQMCLQGPEHCQSCRTYFLRSGQQRSRIECVATCPLGTYLNFTSSECLPCHAHCDRGCSGPLPFVNLTSGCHGCSLVQLFSDGSQVKTCGLIDGYYAR